MMMIQGARSSTSNANNIHHNHHDLSAITKCNNTDGEKVQIRLDQHPSYVSLDKENIACAADEVTTYIHVTSLFSLL
jgi:hypothetical protein